MFEIRDAGFFFKYDYKQLSPVPEGGYFKKTKAMHGTRLQEEREAPGVLPPMQR